MFSEALQSLGYRALLSFSTTALSAGSQSTLRGEDAPLRIINKRGYYFDSFQMSHHFLLFQIINFVQDSVRLLNPLSHIRGILSHVADVFADQPVF